MKLAEKSSDKRRIKPGCVTADVSADMAISHFPMKK